jgi:hypothetical protein
MTENYPVSQANDSTEQRDLLLRRMIVGFVLTAVITFWTAVGMATWNEASHRIELAQQQASLSPTQP